ncbi:MAG: hypothetical protein ACM3PY_14185 [Omnitrophica WOR_2 bacterium]
MNTSNKFNFLEWLMQLFGLRSKPTESPANLQEEAGLQPIHMRSMLIVIDPVMDEARGTKLSQYMGWNHVDDLVKGYIADVAACSGGLVQYEVAGRQEIHDFPPLADGFTYSPGSYLDVMKRGVKAHTPYLIDYLGLVNRFNLIERVQAREIDEVWFFGFPYAGLYESHMAGRGSFWCNSSPLEGSQHGSRRFVMMGFSYERGVGEMLEDLGHRSESVMTKVFEHHHGEANLWQRFTRYDKIAPGQAEVGSVHFAPNSEKDYDWGNSRFVPSKCDDWKSFPALQGAARQVNCAEWGNGDIRLHHIWWLSHLPKTTGRINGISNNWWEYIIQVDHPYFDRL